MGEAVLELIAGQPRLRPENAAWCDRLRGKLFTVFSSVEITESKRVEGDLDTLWADFYLTERGFNRGDSEVVIDLLTQELVETRAEAYARLGVAEFYLIDVDQRQVHAFTHNECGAYTEHWVHGEDAVIWPVFFENRIQGVRVRDILPSRVFYVNER